MGELSTIKDSSRIPNKLWRLSGIPYIRASDLSNEDLSGKIFLSEVIFKYFESQTESPKKGDVLFNGGGEIGKAILKKDDTDIYVQGGAVLYAQTSKSKFLRGEYLVNYFQTPKVKAYISLTQTGGTMKHFTLRPAQELRVIYPNLQEQKQLGEYFKQLDHFITLHQRKLNCLKRVLTFL